jgi:hypothetical protein
MQSGKTASINGSSPDVGSSRISRSSTRGESCHQTELLAVALRIRAGLFGRVELETFDQRVAALGVEVAAEPSEQVDDLTATDFRPQRDVAGTYARRR